MYSFIGKSVLNDHLGSSIDYYIQNHVITNHVMRSLTDMFSLSTYIENILLDDSVYDDTDEKIEENGEQIFETVRIQGDSVLFSCLGISVWNWNKK